MEIYGITNLYHIYGIEPMSFSEEASMPEAAKRTRNNKIYIIDKITSMRRMLDTIEGMARNIPEKDDENHSQLVQLFKKNIDRAYNEVFQAIMIDKKN